MAIELAEVIVGADIGGTHMRAALVRGDGAILFRRELPTPHEANVPDALTDLVSSVAGHALVGERAVTRVVIGLPGQIDYRAGKLLWAPHLPASWPDQLSEQKLQGSIGLPVHIANDADVAALGEAFFGAGRDFRDVAYVTISTGIGAGFVFGGQLLRGDRSLGEIGHTILDWRAWLANQPSMLEELASGSGMTDMATRAGLGALSAEAIAELVHQKDKDALEIWRQAVSAAAAGISSLIMAFSPGIVVVGGGLGRQSEFFTALKETITHGVARALSPTPLVTAALGDDAGLIGTVRWTASGSVGGSG